VPFVQTVQVDEAGTVQLLGVPKEMMEYTPQDGQWLKMLAEYVIHLRWQSTDLVQMDTVWKPNGWLDLYTCGVARQLLKAEYDEVMAGRAKKVKVSLELSNITKIDIPMAFNAQWDEFRVEGSSTGKKSNKSWTFSVGRRPVDSIHMRKFNPFGLCVTNFDKGPLR
jgi:type IV secretory pathway TrbF-like protein